MKLKVEIISVYGREVIYPICEKAHIFAEIVGHKTFTKKDIDLMKKLGCIFEIVQPERGI